MYSNGSSFISNYMTLIFGLIITLLVGMGFHEMEILIPVLLSLGLFCISLRLIERYHFVYYIFPVFIALVFDITYTLFWDGAYGYH